jgi:hypothetical protein
MAAAGALMLLLALLAIRGNRDLPPSFGPSIAPSAAARGSAAAANAAGTITPPGGGGSSEGGVAAPTSATVTSAPVTPTALALPAFGVAAPIVPITATGGVLSPPDDPGTLGWWAGGSLPGSSAGSTVVVGHVDGPNGPGAFYRLVHVKAGDPISLTGADGSVLTYAVTALQFAPKSAALPTALFAATGPPQLILITCGGAFDSGDSQYAQNVIVLAAPSPR